MDSEGDRIGGRVSRRGRRRLSGPVRYSPRIASLSSSQESMSPLSTDGQSTLKMRPRSCHVKGQLSYHTSVLISSIFQFLIDESRRETDKKEFFLPTSQFQKLLEFSPLECDVAKQSEGETTVKYNTIGNSMAMYEKPKLNGREECLRKGGVDDLRKRAIQGSMNQRSHHESTIECLATTCDHEICKSWQHTQTIEVFQGTQIESLTAGVWRSDREVADYVLCHTRVAVHLWLPCWEKLGTWSPQSGLTVSKVYPLLLGDNLVVLAITACPGQCIVHLLSPDGPDEIHAQEVTALKSNSAVCCVMDEAEFLLGYLSGVGKSSSLIKYVVSGSSTKNVTGKIFDGIDQELTVIKSVSDKHLKRIVLGFTGTSHLHIWNGDGGWLLKSIALSSVLYHSPVFVEGFLEKGLLCVPVLDGDESSSMSAGRLVVINPQSETAMTLFPYMINTARNGCKKASVVDDMLVIQDKAGYLHFCHLYSGKHGVTCDQPWNFFSACQNKLYLACKKGNIHVFTLM
ncbi:hypothetical protein ScPMuIL_004361 [Solemya velum]